ncbi:MAG: SGNH/GDSL hydrolase family protein [Chitinophagales bacterium]|nr:SGNH/GDSL hydrolase family protein [Chitinophagales bacterium]
MIKFLFFPLFAYALWEIYQASKVGSLFIKWHTHIALYIYLWIVTIALLFLVNKIIYLKQYTNIQTSATTFWGILLLVEMYLVKFGNMDTYMEKIEYGYVSRYGSNHEDYYRTHKPNEVFYISRPEFNHIRHCNSLGFSDIEWPIQKRKNEKRILVLGDSFTEGVGAPFDSNCVSILRQLFAASDTNVSFMNAANAGDDPCVNFVCYRDLLRKYKPDIIVQTLSSNDMHTDLVTKGGLERFKPNGKVQFEKGPWWEPIYALSHVSRLFFNAVGYNELLIKMPFSVEDKAQLDAKAIALFDTYSKLAQQENALLMVLLQPDQTAVYNKTFEYSLDTIVKHISKFDNVKVASLLPFYLNFFADKQDSITHYYWIQDGHHNAKGYTLMAKSMKYSLDSLTSSIAEELSRRK